MYGGWRVHDVVVVVGPFDVVAGSQTDLYRLFLINNNGEKKRIASRKKRVDALGTLALSST